MLNEFCTFLTFHFVLILSLFFVPFPFYFSNQSKYGAFAGSIFFQVWWPGMGGWSRGSDWVGPLFSTWSTKIVFGPKVDQVPWWRGNATWTFEKSDGNKQKKYKRKSAQSKTQLECEIILHSTCVLFFCIYLCTYFFSLFPSHFSQKVYALSAGKDFRK